MQSTDEMVPVVAWTPAGLDGPMWFDMTDPHAAQGLAGELQVALEGYLSMPDDMTLDPTLGSLSVTAMPKSVVARMPEHPGW